MPRARCCSRGLRILALAALGNAGLGTYHAGVEWGFWQGPTDCTGPIGNLGSAGNLLERLDTVKVIRCDEVQWRFLGPVAGRLQRADLAVDGRDRGLGHRQDDQASLIVDIFLRPSEQMDDARASRW